MGNEKSEAVIVPRNGGNAPGGKGCREVNVHEGETRSMHRNGELVSTTLSRIATLAKQDRQVKFTSLAHLLTPGLLKDSFHKLNKKGAPGADGMTMEVFEANLDPSPAMLNRDSGE